MFIIYGAALTYVILGDGEIGKGNNDDSGSIGGDDIYSSNREKPVLALLSDLYLELEVISIDISRPSFYPTLYYILTI